MTLPFASALSESTFPVMNRLMYSTWIRESFAQYMERNFKNVKGMPCWPMRFWRNRIGPGEEILIAAAIVRKIGERTINAVALPRMSMARFITRDVLVASSRCARSGYSFGLAGHPVL